MNEVEIDYVARLIMGWIKRQLDLKGSSAV